MNQCGCQDYVALTRRRFLGVLGGAGAASFLGLWDPRLLFARPGRNATADSVILLWMAGGQSHIDTWDPKPGTPSGGPFESGQTSVSRRILASSPRIHCPSISIPNCSLIPSELLAIVHVSWFRPFSSSLTVAWPDSENLDTTFLPSTRRGMPPVNPQRMLSRRDVLP